MAAQKTEPVDQLWETLQYGLKKGEEKVKVEVLQTLLARATIEKDEKAVDLETTVAFDFFLQKQKPRLFELAHTNPIEFDNFLGNHRSNYCSVANKLLMAYNGGSSILSAENASIDLHAKQTELFETRWNSFYDDIDDSLESFETSDSIAWCRVAIILRRRQLHDESNAQPHWKERCPFKTLFVNAFQKYPLRDVEKMIGLKSKS